MNYVKVAELIEFSTRNHKVVKLVGRAVGIIKRPDGSFYAVEAACKHQGANLFRNYSGGEIVTCWRHKWRYSLETGCCLNHDSPRLRRYDLKIEEDAVFVSLLPVGLED